MKIAVAGGGVAGLAVLWNLLQFPHVSATLFDPKGIGGGASGVSTGLLHPFPGRQALRSRQSEEGMKESRELLQVAANALGRPVDVKNGILRPAVSDQQKRDFRIRSEEDRETSWIENEPITKGPALWIPNGITVFSALYLQGLWKACEKRGAKLVLEPLNEREAFDAVIYATGSDTLKWEECRHLPLKLTKGQTLICRWPESLPVSLVSQGHITPTENPELCQIGSTYEREFDSLEPDEKALELLEKAAVFYPPARDFIVVEARAGVRISPVSGYRPLCMKIAPRTWVFTGLGSRGLLYHAWMGKALARAVSSGCDDLRIGI